MSVQTFPTDGPVDLDLDVGTGAVRVIASDRAGAAIDVRPHNEGSIADRKAADEARVELVNGTVMLRAVKTWRRFTPINDGAIDVVAEVPSGSRVAVRSALGDLSCDGAVGDCQLKTGMGRLLVEQASSVQLDTGFGDITVQRADGAADLATGSGRIQLHHAGGNAVVRNSNGETVLGEIGGAVRVKSANGDIRIARTERSVVAKTAAGSIRIGEVVRGEVVAQSGAGDVEVGVREGTAAWLDLNAPHGAVRSALTASGPPTSAADVVEIRATTSFGDVVVHRVPAVRPAADDDEGSES